MEPWPLVLAAAAMAGAILVLRRLATRMVERMVARHVPRTGLRPDLDLGPPAASDLVLALHGTACDGATMGFLAGALGRDGYRVWSFEYRYTRPIPENVRILAEQVAARLADPATPAPRRILVVGYSQGGLLGRALLSGPGGPAWLERVVGLIQIGTPNLGTPSAKIVRLAWGGPLAAEPPFASIRQMIPGSRLLRTLAARPLRPGVGLGLIHGLGPGRTLLERFLYGDVAGRLWLHLVGAIYEWLFLSRCEHDSLVPSESALGILALPGLTGEPDPVLVPTDHLGLLVDPRAARALVDLAGQLMRNSDRRLT